MAQLIVRNIEDSVKDRLRHRARRHGRSMEEEARAILRQAVLAEPQPKAGIGTQISSRFKNLGVDFDIPEMRGQQLRAARLPK